MPNGHRNGGGEGGGDIDQLWESSAYERKYDASDTEVNSSSFLEQPDFQREALLRQQLAQQGGAAPAPRVVSFWPDVGPFAIPAENTWAAHVALISDDRKGLQFNPAKHPYFDNIIAARFPAALLPENAGLRANLEVLRNDIMGIYLNDGSFDPGDEAYIPLIATIADSLGNALAGDTWWKRPFMPSISVGVANAPGVGAAEMYTYLLEIQDKPGALASIGEFFRSKLSMPTRAFGLPPLAQTPFSPPGLAAPPPRAPGAASAERPPGFAARLTGRTPGGTLRKG
ncbi:MAG: hypothetical protein KGI29_00970 [Pseudomonadota bacterium]|nr:hypothetical protein [Pseudomonadota bacterium]